MSTVFRKIRKNQKVWLATLGVLAMLCFVFIPIMMQNQGGNVGKTTVVTSRVGNLDEFQIQELYQQRVRAIRFFSSLGNVMQNSADQEYQRLLKDGLQDMDAFMKAQQRAQAGGKASMLARRLESSVNEESLVYEWLQAKLAEKEGIVVNDAMISEFVNGLVDNLMTKSDYKLAKENAAIHNGSEIDKSLSFLLLAGEYRRIYEGNFNNLSIADQWDNFTKVNRFVTLDAYPVRVADFVDDVPEPSQPELLGFFHQYKERFSDPLTGAPGFKVRRHAELEYMMANVDNFVDVDAVTEAEILAFYNQNKQLYIKMPEIDVPEVRIPDMPNLFQNREREVPEGGLTLEGEIQDELPGTETSPAVDEIKIEEIEIPVDAPADETPAPAPAEETPAVAPAEETPAPTPAEETPAPAEETSAPAPAEEAPAVTPEEETSAPAPAEETTATGKKSVFRQVAFVQADQVPTVPPNLGSYTPPAMEYRPLSEVLEDVRQQVALQKASQLLDEKLRQANEELDAFSRAHQAYLISKERAATMKTEFKEEVPKFDFAACAKRYGFLIVEPLKSYDIVDLMGEPLGHSRAMNSNRPFAETLFAGSAEYMEYTPFLTGDEEGNRFLGWSISQKAAYVPTMDEPGMAEKVARAWKFEKARPLAEVAAKKTAEECTAAGSMSKLGDAVVTTNSFPWFTFGELNEMQMRHTTPVLSMVEGIDTPIKRNAGPDFMAVAFGLTGTKCDIAPSMDRSTLYVLQAKSFSPSDEVLQQLFSLDRAGSYQPVATMKMRGVATEWLKQLKEKTNMEWRRAARHQAAEEE